MKSLIPIIGVEIRDYKRIRVFNLEIDPEGNCVVIGGENGHGKSSAIDAIEAALIGTQREITNPVRNGAKEAKIVVRTPKFTVTRRFAKGPDGKTKTELAVTDELGLPPSAAKEFLRGFLTDNFVDPVELGQIQPIARREQMCSLVGIDWDADFRQPKDEALREERELDQKRDMVRTHAVERKKEFDNFGFKEDAIPDEPTDVSTLTQAVEELQEIAKANATKRQQIVYCKQRIDDNNAEIESLKAKIAEIESDNLKRVDWLAQNPDPGQDPDPAPFMEQIKEADKVNAAVRAKQFVVKSRQEFNDVEAQRVEAAKRVLTIEADFRERLRNTKFPVEGLSVDDSDITFEGVPFAQCSQAERIRIGMAVALALKGKCAPILIRDGSLLDGKSRRMIVDMAAQAGAQVFIETVTDSDSPETESRCTIVLEEGTARAPKALEVAS